MLADERLPVAARRPRAAVRQGVDRHRLAHPAARDGRRGRRHLAGAAGRQLRRLPVAGQRRADRPRAAAGAAADRVGRQRGQRGRQDGRAERPRAGRGALDRRTRSSTSSCPAARTSTTCSSTSWRSRDDPTIVACGALAVHVQAVARRRGLDVERAPAAGAAAQPPGADRAGGRGGARRRRRRGRVRRLRHLRRARRGARRRPAAAGRPLLRRARAATQAQAALEEEPGTYLLTDFLARTFEHTVCASSASTATPSCATPTSATTRACSGSPSTRRPPPARRPSAPPRTSGCRSRSARSATSALERQLEDAADGMTLRIGDEPLAPAALVAAARGGALDVELTPAARERMAAGHARPRRSRPCARSTAAPPASAPTGTSTSSATSAATRCGSCAATPAGSASALPEDVVRATILVRLAQMAAGGGSRPEVAARARRHARRRPRADRARPRRARDRRPHRARAARAGAGRRGRGRRAAAAGGRAGRRAAADELQRRHLRHRGAGVGGPGRPARRRDRRRRAELPGAAAATARRSPTRSRRPARCPASRAVSARLRALTAGAEPPARRQDPFGLRCLPPVAGALARRARRAARRARRRDQRRRREPAVRGRRGAAQRRLPRRQLRAGARQPAAGARPVRQPVGRPALPPDGARPHRPDAVPGRRRGQLGADDRRVPGRRRARAAADGRDAGRARLGVDLARPRGARQLRLAVGRPRPPRGRPGAHRARRSSGWRPSARCACAGCPPTGVAGARPRARAPASTIGSRTGRSARTGRAPRRRCRPSPSWSARSSRAGCWPPGTPGPRRPASSCRGRRRRSSRSSPPRSAAC